MALAETLRATYEAATPQERLGLAKRKAQLEREEEKFRRELAQQEEERARAEAA